jgi:hypothetical protein
VTLRPLYARLPVRPGSFVSWLPPFVRGLRSTPRRVWWTSFLLATSLSCLWALANPPLAGPDEPAHAIRAVALDHGQLTGKDPDRPVSPRFNLVEDSARIVRAPSIYRPVSGPPCFALQQGVAACLRFAGPTRTTDVVTYAARQPPAYYAIVGVASWGVPAGSVAVYAMRLIGALITGALIATAVTALRRATMPPLLAVGVLLATTPMVLFTGGLVNPSGPEIAASIALWVCGLVLVSERRERIDNRLVAAVGIAACVLALSRWIGPLWLGLIAIFVASLSNRSALRTLARSGWARLWAVLVLVACGFQIAWDVVARPGDPTLVNRRPTRLAVIEPFAHTGSMVRWLREMVGWFGWLDTPAPVLTWLPWTLAVAFLFFVALGWVSRRSALILLGLLAAVIVVSVIADNTLYDSRETYWQGRYVLPLAVGLPIVAAMTLASTERGRQLVTSRLLVTFGVGIGVAQFLAFAQNLRRYTVGYDGAIQFWRSSRWAPPLPSLVLTIAFAIVMTAFIGWLLYSPGFEQRTPVSARRISSTGPARPGRRA